MPIRIKAKVDADRASDEFKQARREIQGRQKAAMRELAEEIALPHVKAKARLHVGRFADALKATATTRAAFITAKNVKSGRIIGLHNFGGTVGAPILPKSGKALTVGDGIVAKVSTPRKYSGKDFLYPAVQDKVPEYEAALLTHIMQAFDGLEHAP